MQVSKEDLNNFKNIYFKEHGIKLTDKEALDLAIPLLTLVKNVVLPNENN